jgi:hypothetical protein
MALKVTRSMWTLVQSIIETPKSVERSNLARPTLSFTLYFFLVKYFQKDVKCKSSGIVIFGLLLNGLWFYFKNLFNSELSVLAFWENLQS